MRPSLAAKPFSDPGWLFEPKWDGWRTFCFVREGKVHFLSRSKNSLDERFPELREIGKTIKANSPLIDGEVVALGEELTAIRCIAVPAGSKVFDSVLCLRLAALGWL
jgi:ATP-dependent DNA ligase